MDSSLIQRKLSHIIVLNNSVLCPPGCTSQDHLTWQCMILPPSESHPPTLNVSLDSILNLSQEGNLPLTISTKLANDSANKYIYRTIIFKIHRRHKTTTTMTPTIPNYTSQHTGSLQFGKFQSQ